MEVYLREFKSQRDVVVAVCDRELLGKCFKEGKLTLDVRKEFYEGTLVSIDGALQTIESSTIANIVGEKIISKMIEAGLICEESVIRVSGVPHAQRVVI
jgi:hypothetical protein